MQIIYLISKLINHWMAGLHNLKTILSSCSSYLCINWIGLDAVPLDFCIPEWSTKICKKCNLEKLLYMFAIFLANSAISLYEIPIVRYIGLKKLWYTIRSITCYSLGCLKCVESLKVNYFLYNCWVFIPCRKEEIHSLEGGKSVFLP